MAGPITLNRAQFARTKAGAAGGTYAKYLHYLSVHRQAPGSLGEAKDVPPFTRPVSPRNAQVPTNTQNPHPAAPATMTKPLAPHPTANAPAQPQPTLAELALKAATQAVQPQVDLLNQQAERGQAAISGYTQQFAADLGKIGQQTQGFYSDAAKSMAGLNGAVANAISTGGQEQATALLNEIASHGVATGDAGDLVGQAQGAGNANLTSGASVLGALLASGAAADSRAAAMPGIAALSGLQQTRILQGNTQDKVAQALAQIPGLSQTVQGNLAQEQNYRATQQNYQETQKLNQRRLADSEASAREKTAYQNQLLQLTGFKAETSAKQGAARVGIAQQNANTAATRAENSYRVSQQNANTAAFRAQTAAQRASAASAEADRRIRIQQQNANTSQWKATHPNQAKPSRLTAKQVQDYKGKAATVAENGRHGFHTTDKQGNVTKYPPLNRKQAINEARKEGIPLEIFIPYLNMWYGPPKKAGK